MEKTTLIDNITSEQIGEVKALQIKIDYWKRVGKLIENKVSLGQSILSNITSQVKAGLYFNNVK